MVKNRATLYDFPEAGHYKQLKINTSHIDWADVYDKQIIQPNWVDIDTIVLIVTFNIFNPSLNSVQSFKLINSVQSGGIVVMEYDDINVNLQLFQYSDQKLQSILIFIIGAVLLIISILDMRNQKKQAKEQEQLEKDDKLRSMGKKAKQDEESKSNSELHGGEKENGQDLVDKIEKEKKDKKKNEEKKKKKGIFKRLKCCQAFNLKGVSTFEIINFLMIMCTFLN